MERRTIFPGRLLPVALVAPQLLLTAVFFLWPAAQAGWLSLTREDPFGLSAEFVGLANYTALFADPLYRASVTRTVFFCFAVSALSMLVALVLAVFADQEIRGRDIYRTLLIWPYAVAPALAAVLWLLLVHPQIGLLGRPLDHLLAQFGGRWDYKLDGGQAMLVLILASAWKQVSYNFIFFLAGLQSIPRAVIEAARMDGARGWRRFRSIVLPLLMPTIFFLLVVNLVYAAFDTFGTIQALTQGGPGQSTQTLVVKVYRDGHDNGDLGSSSAQSVVLMIGVIALTAAQFRFLGRKAE
jgi:sn-glycerol 3-phosphate transport system permease protein